MANTPGPTGPGRLAAWWRRTARRPAVLWTVLAINLFVGLEAVGLVAFTTFDRPKPVNVGRVGRPPAAIVTQGEPQPEEAPQPSPVAVDIPSIGVHSDLVRLHLDSAGVLNGPTEYPVAGWWEGGPLPGSTGAAVLVGHVDSYRGPAVFFKVPTLKPGAKVDVLRADGSTASFVVDAVQQYPKESLPTERVYGPTPRPELRLITCGGQFDRLRKSYRDNVVVYAHQERPAPTGPTM